MSWSHSLVAENLKDGKDAMITLQNESQSLSESVVYDYNDYFLFDEDNSPYLIIGENLKTQVGDFIDIDGNLAQVTSYAKSVKI